jgi:hypothetical protein
VFSSFGDEERDWWWCEEADPGQEDISSPLRRLFFFFSFSSFIIQNKATNNKRIHFQVFLIAEKVPCRFVRCRQFLLPSFFAALNGTKTDPKNGPRLSSLTGWVAAA